MPLGLIARRADQASFCRSEPRIVETVRRRCVRLVKGARLGDGTYSDLAQLVGGVEAEGDAIDLCHLWLAQRCVARRGGVSTSGVQCSAKASLSRAAVLRFAAHASAGLPGSARRALRLQWLV